MGFATTYRNDDNLLKHVADFGFNDWTKLYLEQYIRSYENHPDGLNEFRKDVKTYIKQKNNNVENSLYENNRIYYKHYYADKKKLVELNQELVTWLEAVTILGTDDAQTIKYKRGLIKLNNQKLMDRYGELDMVLRA